MRDLIVELKLLRLHGMAAGWGELLEQGNVEVVPSQWLLERLLQAENADRAVRSVSHQMNAAKVPGHRNIAGFDFEGSPVDRQLVMQLASMTFTEGTHNLFWSADRGLGRHIWSRLSACPARMHHGKRVGFYSTVDLANAMEQKKAQGRGGRIVRELTAPRSGHPR